MSIQSLTTKEVERLIRELPRDERELMLLEEPGEDRDDNVLEALTKYIPTETVALYIAAIAIAPIIVTETGYAKAATAIFWAGVILTPLIMYLVLVGKRAKLYKEAKKKGAKKIPSKWVFPLPAWKMIAATLAYGVWALAVPNNPYVTTDGGAAIVAFVALFFSTFLSLFDNIFDPEIAPDPQPEGQT